MHFSKIIYYSLKAHIPHYCTISQQNKMYATQNNFWFNINIYKKKYPSKTFKKCKESYSLIISHRRSCKPGKIEKLL